MKKQWKGFLTGFLTAALLLCLGSPAFAATVRQLNATFNNIKITIDGTEFVPKDFNGNKLEPFTVDGATYLPVRAVAEALGLTVEWDQAAQTVKLTRPGSRPTQQPSTPAGQEVSYRITNQNCKVRANGIGGTSYLAIVEVENTGTANLYLSDATFDFEDRNGHLLETKDFVSEDPDIIAPGEKGYFYAQGTLEKVTEGTDYVFKPAIKVEKSKNSIIRYAISDTSKENTSNGGITITGRVTNNTSNDDSLVWVSFILFRADGTPITAGGTNLLDLKAGETRSFSRSFSAYELDVDASEVASYKIYAGKMQLQF